MERIVQNEKIGTIIYTESFLTGKKSVNVNGVQLKRIEKNTFQLLDGDTATISGNSITGIRLGINGEVIQISKPMKWYELAITVFFFVFVIAWGASSALVSILPVVGGAVGGAITGALSILGVFFAAAREKKLHRILMLVLFGILSFVACMSVGFILIAIA